MTRFVDVHSHVVPSGDDGAQTVEEGLRLCREAAGHGTGVLFATPHVWPALPLYLDREKRVRAAHAEMAARAAEWGLDLRLGWELTPAPRLLEEDMERYRLGDLPAVLMELPFHGTLEVAERLAAHIQDSGLTAVIAHPERSEALTGDLGGLQRFHGPGLLLQLNATSLLGYHGPLIEAAAWQLVDEDRADLVASDGHRPARPPFLDEAHRLVRARVGERGTALFDGRALPAPVPLARPDRLDLAQRS